MSQIIEEQDVRDVVVVGSGLGALACASFLTRIYGHSVTVIEQHSQPGGLSGVITTDIDAEFEIGIHQVGELHPSSMFSKLMSCISDGQSVWRKLPDTFIKFHYPDFVYEVSAGEQEQIAKLIKLFPAETDNVRQYYKDIASITKWYRSFTSETLARNQQNLQLLLDTEIGKMAMMTTEAYLNFRFSDVKLQSLISSHWTDYGLPPRSSAMLKHAILVNNHKDGVYYPELGSQQLIQSITQCIEDNGGQILTNSLVTNIRHEHDVARAVTVKNLVTGEIRCIQARTVISGIGVINTYTRLLDLPLATELKDALKSYQSQGVSFVKLYATLKQSPVSIRADESLAWVYPGYDHNKNFDERGSFHTEKLSQFSISFPSLKKVNSKKHTMKINTLVDFKSFEKWHAEQVAVIGEAEANTILASNLLAAAERKFPGLSELVDRWDLYTPLSAKKNTQHVDGNIFGIPDTPARYLNLNLNCFTPLKNVYITGTDITSSGIYGAVLSGALTASAVLEDKQFFLKVVQKVSATKGRAMAS